MFIRTLFFATLCFWGALFAIFPVISIAISEYSTSSSPVNEFVRLNKEVLLSIGTLLLISFLALIQTYISNKSSDSRDQANRAVQAELKIAEFRQEWINSLRDELEEFNQLAFADPKERDNSRISAVLAKVRMRLNLNESLALSLYKAMLEAGRTDHRSGEDEVAALISLNEAAHKYLSNEWKRLKDDIIKAQLLQDGTP